MATFIAVKPLNSEETDITAASLDLNAGPHAFIFAKRQTLTIQNGEAVPITVNILGDGQTTVDFPGYGEVDVSLGKDFVVAAGDTVAVAMFYVSQYLGATGNNVAVTVSGSTAPALASAWLAEY